jgi:hypothetical protein
MHIFQSGGHGYGLRADRGICATWPDRCRDWFTVRGLLEKNGL